jgi:hypothetical protein
MFLPFTNGLIRTTHFDQEARQLADRHYSRPKRSIGKRQFSRNGSKIVLRDALGDVLFVWTTDSVPRWDGQEGYNCAIFRNESSRRSSEIIVEAEHAAVAKWGPGRAYTYVDPSKIKSRNPGYCFKMAGWTFVGVSKNGKHILEKYLT